MSKEDIILTICFAASHKCSWDLRFTKFDVFYFLGRKVAMENIEEIFKILYDKGFIHRCGEYGDWLVSEKGEQYIIKAVT